ncbi:mucin-2 isoform X1 [Mixophyes fleayi]|uniref:mucin-2 isoform X1 n=1 Tax=Mixophyes fleayi TaxID=3061075 RepID=UPI003F4E102A
MTPCSSSARETCLKSVILLTDNKQNVVSFKADGTVLLNELKITLPHVTATFSILQPSDSYIIVQATYGLQMQIQLLPIMQLYITMEKSARKRLQGLCGNFNSKEGDDFETSGGLVEATASAFANTWKAQPSCHDMSDWLDDPCSLSIENKNYADYWCSMLEKDESHFAKCHSTIDPTEYAKRCRYDSCNCKNSEICMCAALSSYVRACAAKGIILWGWRKGICDKDVASCPSSQVYLYNLTTCQPTCRSLAEGEKACSSIFTAVDGCGCPDGEYLNEKDECVSIAKCSCYYHGTYLNPLEVIYKQDERCSCHNGKLICNTHIIEACPKGKVYFDCNKVQSDVSGAQRHRSCKTLNVEYFQTECISGCVCPNGLLDDGAGGCVPEDRCPCVHNEDIFPHGTQVKVDCNTCLCQKGRWTCTHAVCYGTCTIYGNGHYITFDERFYDFDGNCEFVAVQDYCGPNHSSGNFSIITENIPCGTTGVTCSKSIKVFLGSTVLKLVEKHLEETVGQDGKHVQYLTREVGIYLVIEASNGILLIWDRKTTIFIKVSPAYKGKLCGLCGNFDDNSQNDFKTSHMLQVNDVLEFGNSWKVDPSCPDATDVVDPCSQNPHRHSWAEKQCGLIKSQVFKVCHSKVDPKPFYEACVNDACSCDSGGDCECFCTAVAAYAQECTKAGACVYWRTPDICPIFCDYYNPKDECEWHYHPCGNHSLQTCRSINNVYTNVTITYLEGCYPTCPKDKPIFDETKKICVTQEECGCYINNTHYEPGDEVPHDKNCHTCICTPEAEVSCKYNQSACVCIINGTIYEEGEIISKEEQSGVCIVIKCVNGTEKVEIDVCSTSVPTTSSTTTFTTTSTATTLTTTVTTTVPSTTPQSSTTCVYEKVCRWTQWFDVSKPGEGLDSGDYETYEEIRKHHKFCNVPDQIQCRAANAPDVSLDDLNQKVHCNVSYGFICKNSEQELDDNLWQKCFNYEIRVDCCEDECVHSTSITTTPSTTTPTTTGPTTTTPTTTGPTTTTPTTTGPTTTTPTTTGPTTTTPTTTGPTTTTPTTTGPTTTTPTTTGPTTTTPTTTGPTTTTPTTTGPTTTTPTTTGPTTTGPTTTTPTTAPTTTITETTTTTTTSEPTTTPPIITTTECITETEETTPFTTVPSTIYSSATTSCIPECSWSQWFDVSYPKYEPNGGDFETYENIVNAGHVLCEKPENISCRAQKFPDMPLDELGQIVTCDVSYGLICNNKDQTGFMPVCYNYEISVYCCKPLPEDCLTTTSPEPTTSTTTKTTTITSPSTTTPVPSSPTTIITETTTPEITTSTTSKTTTRTESTTSLTTSPTTITIETTTIPDTTTSSEPTTPTTTKTTAITSPSTTTPVPSSPTTIITETTTPEIRTPTPEKITSTTSPTSEPTTPTTTSTTTQPTTTSLTTSTITTTSPPIITTTECTTETEETTPFTIVPSTTYSSATTSCVPECSWSQWFDVSYPKYEPNGGDFETYENIVNAGHVLCEKPENISCRAQKFPDRPLDELGQIVTCDVSYGLICNNKDQTGFMPVCYNYEISVYCCKPLPEDCLTTITQTTTTESTTSTTPKTTTSTTESTTSLTTSPTTITSESTTILDTTPFSEPTFPTTTKTTTITSPSTTTPVPSSPTTIITETTTPEITTSPEITSTPETTTPTTAKTTTITSPSPTTPVPSSPTTIITETTTPEITTPTTTKTTTTTPESTTSVTPPQSTTPNCIPECSWTKWFDVSYPKYEPNGGDYETYENIVNAGYVLCEKPENISCRAQKFPDRPLDELGQIVTCDVSYGLICNNKDQTGFMPVCYNYEISVYCCKPLPVYCLTTTSPEPTTPTTTKTTTITSPSTTPPVPSSPTTIITETTTPEITTSTTSKTTTRTESTTSSTTSPTTITIETTTIPDTTTSSEPTTPTTTKTTTITSPSTTPPVPSSPTTIITETTTPEITTSPEITTTSETTTPTTAKTTTITSLSPTTPVPSSPTTIITETTTPEITTPTTIKITTLTYPTTTSVTPPPTTITTSVPSTTYSSATTSCVPECSWSQWFDVSYPKYEPNGGDYETYENIVNAGHVLCEKPENVSCRAQKFPDRPLDELGQIVTCDVSYGLICNNKDQTGFMPVCYNYEISVYCCKPLPEDCLTTTTLEPTTSTTTKTTTITSPSTTTPVPSSPTTIITETTTPEITTSTTTKTTTRTESTTSLTTSPTTITIESTTIPDTTTSSEPTTPTTTKTTAITSPSTTTPVPSSPTTIITETTTPEIRTPTPEKITSTTSPTSEPTTPTTTSTTTQPTTTSLTTSTITTTSPPIITTTECTTETEETTPFTTVPSTTYSSATTSCVPDCSWSQWFDVSYPKYEPNGGDYETYENIVNAGHVLCEKPENVSCRAQKFPDRPLDELGQIVTCDVSYGLICNNKDQTGFMPVCYNYEISVYCCKPLPEDCLTTITQTTTTESTTLTTTKTTATATESTTIPDTTTSSEPTTPITTKTTTITSPSTTTPVPSSPTTIITETTTPEITTSPEITTTPESTTPTTAKTTTITSESTTSVTPPPTTTPNCIPECSWTKWFDVSYPKYEPNGGDYETYENIVNAGYVLCEKPENISCRAQKFPDIPLDELGQIVTCDVSYGLICNNKDQTGFMPVCYNYEISVYCCKPLPAHCFSTTPQPTTTSQSTTTSVSTPPTTTVTETSTTSEAPTPSTTKTSTITSPSTPTSVPSPPTTIITETTSPEITTSPKITTTPESISPTTTKTTTSTTESTTSLTTSPTTITIETTTIPDTTTSSEPTTPTTTKTTTITSPRTTTPVPSSPTTIITETTTPEITTSPEITTTPESTTPTTTKTTTITTERTTSVTPPPTTTPNCIPECSWTKWFDVSYPKYEPNGGDYETYENIVNAGHVLCEKPENISCRAQKFPDRPLDELGQKVTCDVSYGLICNNKDQTGFMPVCYNYEISVYCCKPLPAHCFSTTPQPTTTSQSTTTSVSTPPTTTVTESSTTSEAPTPSTTKMSTITSPSTPTSVPSSPTTIITETTSPEITTSPKITTTPESISPTTTKTTTSTTESTTSLTTSPTTFTIETTTIPDTTTSSEPTTPTTTKTTTITSPSTTTPVPSSPTTIITETTTPEITTSPEITTTPESTTPTITKTTTITTESTTSVTPPPTTTPNCIPECSWTKWFDVSYPKYEPNGGDYETYKNIVNAGHPLCEKPENISCRAQKFPDRPLDELGQKVTCDVSYGLICNNKDQTGFMPVCYNYEISVYCCKPLPAHCFSTTPQPTTTSQSTTTSVSTPPTTTVTETSTTSEAPTPSTTKTSTITSPSTPTSVPSPPTTIITETTSPEITTSPKITTTPESTTSTTTKTTTITTESTTSVTPPPTTTTTTQSTATSPTTTVIKTSTTPETSTPTTTESTTTTTESTTSLTTSPTTITAETTTIPTTTTPPTTSFHVVISTPKPTTIITEAQVTSCVPDCSWSQWFDVSYPEYEPNGGDNETYENIVNAGHVLCEKPENISCRAQKFPDRPLDELGQIVTCDVSYGLICNNKDQTGFMPVCYNYEISVYCCKPLPAHCFSTTPQSTSTTTTQSTTTSVSTSPTTTVTETSTTSEAPTPTTTKTTTSTTESTTSLTTSPTTITIETTTIPYTTTSSEPTTPTTTKTTTVTSPITTTPVPSSPTTIITETTTPEITTSPEITTTPESTTPTTTKTTTITTESTSVTPPPSITTTTQSTTTSPTTTVIETSTTPETSTPTTTESTTTTTESTTSLTTSPTTITAETTTIPTTTTLSTTTFHVVISTPKSTTILTGPQGSPTSVSTAGTIKTTPKISSTIPTTSETLPTTSSVTTTPLTTTTAETTISSSTMCVCVFDGTPYPPGEIISGVANKTWCYKVICSMECQIEVQELPCLTPSTTPFPGSTPTPLLTTTPGASTTPEPTTTTGSTPTPEITTTSRTTTTPEVTTTPGSTPTPEITTTPGATTTSEVTTTPGSTPTPEVTTTPGTTTTPGSTPTPEITTTPGATTTSEVTTTPGSTPTPEVTTTPGTTTTPGSTPTPEITTTPGATTTSEVTTTPGSTLTPEVTTTPGTTTTPGSTPTPEFTTISEPTTTPKFTTPGSTPTPESTTTIRSTPPTTHTTTSKPTTTSSTVPTTVKKPGCPFEPHREHNETWVLCNCTMARCLENNTVEIIELKCEPPPMITCANGQQPIVVPDDDLCCWHWECDCLCSGWGDPHYVTFDGTYYSYQGNCTYTLVEEIEKKIDNFGVYIDNYDCGAEDLVSCPRNIIVRHESQIIRIEAKSLTSLSLQVIVNEEIVETPYKKYGVKVYKSGINYVVEIPELKANITYNGLAFSIKLPYRLFGHNTQGQCGTCTNNKTDDCLTRSGNIISNCEIMADTWIVPDPRKPQCGQHRPTVPPTVPSVPCQPSPLCSLIMGPTFQECHKTLAPKDFYEACIYDSCHVSNSNIECTSLQHYALLCADQGVCIEWRKQAPECPLSCPSHKVYNACGPALSKTCLTTPEEDELIKSDTRLVEGCFCPHGTMPFSSGTDVCVQTCGCVGPDNIPREFGEEFQFDCQDCICREGGSGIICAKHPCSALKKVHCPHEGSYPEIQSSPSDSCCNETVCKCNTSLCSNNSPKCGLGYEAVGSIPDGHCCPVYKCVSKRVCVHGNAEYMPGSPVYSDKCQSCVCSENSTSGLEIKCVHVPCNVNCPLGFELKESQRDCCGICQQTHCVLNQNGLQQLMKPGEMIRAENDNCTVYSCTMIRNQFITSISQISCPYFNENDCEPETIQLLPNGCCKICIEKKTTCELQQYYDYLSHNNCRTTDMVKMSRCEGSCGTFSIYSAAARTMSHKCTCCQEVQTSQKHVQLQCTDGSQVDHEYIDVEQCKCVNTDCGHETSVEEKTPVRVRRSRRRNK